MSFLTIRERFDHLESLGIVMPIRYASAFCLRVKIHETISTIGLNEEERREGDSNPRYGLTRITV
jgi:hypothetical protein